MNSALFVPQYKAGLIYLISTSLLKKAKSAPCFCSEFAQSSKDVNRSRRKQDSDVACANSDVNQLD